MKKIIFSVCVLLFMAFIISCEKEKNKIPDNAVPPGATLSATPVAKASGWYEVRLAGTVEDSQGIKSIHIKCDAFKLDQTIKVTMDPITTLYDLDRIVKAPLSVQNESNTIEVTIENIYGLTKTLSLTISDIEAPSFETPLTDFIVEIVNNKASLDLAFTAIDNKELKSVVVKVPALSIHDSTAISGTNFNFSKKLDLPLKKGSFPVSVILEDASGLKVQKDVLIRVSRAVPYTGDIDLYITPLKSQGEFARYFSGMPGIITKKGNYLYEARYYSPEPGTEVFFLGQKEFSGYRFGQDPLGDPGTLTSNETVSQPIVLPERGYYKISLDTKTETYTLETYTPPASDLWPLPNNPLAMTGAYFTDYPTANRPKAAVECIQDAHNPYLYKTRVKMHKLISFTFTPKDPVNDKWLSPFWRYDKSLDGKLIQGGSGKNNSYNLPDQDAVYWIIITLDTHLNTCTVENDGLAE